MRVHHPALGHPHVSAAVAQLHEEGRPSLALLSDLSAPQRLGCVCIDNRQRGRVTAGAVRRLSRCEGRGEGEVAVFIGSHRYLGQETSEMAFRAALREEGAGRGIVVVAHGLTPEHREALVDGVIDLVIETPIGPVAFGQPFVLPFALYTSENV